MLHDILIFLAWFYGIALAGIGLIAISFFIFIFNEIFISKGK